MKEKSYLFLGNRKIGFFFFFHERKIRSVFYMYKKYEKDFLRRGFHS